MYNTPGSSAFIGTKSSVSDYAKLEAQAKSKVPHRSNTVRISCRKETIGGTIAACCHGEDILGLWTTGAVCSFGTK